ncbi:MAG: hypothetical protein HZT40_19620 [Candidatus Thiothrix singaporensis]|uniref:Uncharacterized protein n=1 Tax=Candidatus Thiothrix singaporensis TaxID=2799669 RepID=A0A7L6AWN9_9GAMM|nr:MAG: hypothetical protein HZT40_19620 [Candidatus Thiothrix singaporensis]
MDDSSDCIFGVARLVFRQIVKAEKVWLFIGAVILSMWFYLFFRPTCGCIGIDQIMGALMLALPFNLVVFLLHLFWPIFG